MKEISKAKQKYHSLEAEIAEKSVLLCKIGKSIGETEGPFNKGDLVMYNAYPNDPLKNGKIASVEFKGVTIGNYLNQWRIEILPLTKDNKRPNRISYPVVITARGHIELQNS